MIMKRLLYLSVCALALVSLTDCKQKPKTASAGEVAKVSHEYLKTGNYDTYVNNCIAYDRNATADQIKAQKTENAKIMRTHANTVINKNGGTKNVVLKSEKVAADGRNATVVLTNHYNDGSYEDIIYDMVLDNDNVWRVKMGRDREVWRTVNADGVRDVYKLKYNNTEEHHRDVWKEIEGGNKEVLKDKGNEHKEVVKVKDQGHKDVIKVKEKPKGEVIKLKEDGHKEVIKVKETRQGEVIKVKEDGHKEVIHENNNNIEKLREHANAIETSKVHNASDIHRTSYDVEVIEDNANREVILVAPHAAAVEEVVYDNMNVLNARDVMTLGMDQAINDVLNDEYKAIVKEKHTGHRDVIKYFEDGEKGFVKAIERKKRETLKEKEDGVKEFTKVIDRRNKTLIKTLRDGRRSTEVIAD